MITPTETHRPAGPASGFGPLRDFALAILRSGWNDRRGLAITLLTPVFMLMVFWFTTRAQADRGTEMMEFVFPGIVSFTAMMPGLSHAMRVTTWRQHGVFRRLACTPVPPGRLMLAAAVAQWLLGLIQVAALILFGAAVLGATVSWSGTLAAMGALALGSACFIAFGLLIASRWSRAETVNIPFIFTLMPMAFLGNTFLPAELMPPAVRTIGPWLPTQMLTELTRPLMNGGGLSAGALLPVLGLVGYTLLFSLVAIMIFKWEME